MRCLPLDTNCQADRSLLADVPFLQGRSFVFASQFAEILPQSLAKQYLDAAVQVLDSTEAGVPVKVSAVRALTK